MGPSLSDSDDICGPKWRLKCPRNVRPFWMLQAVGPRFLFQLLCLQFVADHLDCDVDIIIVVQVVAII